MSARFRHLILLWLAAAALSLRAATGPQTILFFGDSLTAGHGLRNPGAEAFPALIQVKINEAHLLWHVINAGLSGETTAGGLRRVDWVLQQHVDIFVLALGGNDGIRGIEPAVSRQNLQGIIDRVRAKYPAARIVLAGMQMPEMLGEDYVREFAAMYPALAAENKVSLVPFLLAGVGGVPELNQGDGIHPTPEGHAIVADNVWKVLRPLL